MPAWHQLEPSTAVQAPFQRLNFSTLLSPRVGLPISFRSCHNVMLRSGYSCTLISVVDGDCALETVAITA